MSVSSFIGVLAIFALLFAILSPPTLALYPAPVPAGKCFYFLFFKYA
jgi:hypothetical protein